VLRLLLQQLFTRRIWLAANISTAVKREDKAKLFSVRQPV
jgi:hypothetical protein